jgi:hypothetical protein
MRENAMQTFALLAAAGAFLAVLTACRISQLRRIHGARTPIDPVPLGPMKVHRPWC